MLLSLYGKSNPECIKNKLTGMRRSGNLFNPLYGATITGSVRARLGEIIRLNNYEGVVGTATDGIIFDQNRTSPIVLPPRKYDVTIAGIESNLGEWMLELDDADCLILMSGVYSLRSRSRNNSETGRPYCKTTFRGSYFCFIRAAAGADWPVDWFDFCETFADRSIVVRDADNKPFMRPYSIGEARIRKDYKLINQFRIVDQSVKALGDSNKREWGARRPKTFGDLRSRWYKSRPHKNII